MTTQTEITAAERRREVIYKKSGKIGTALQMRKLRKPGQRPTERGGGGKPGQRKVLKKRTVTRDGEKEQKTGGVNR